MTWRALSLFCRQPGSLEDAVRPADRLNPDTAGILSFETVNSLLVCRPVALFLHITYAGAYVKKFGLEMDALYIVKIKIGFIERKRLRIVRVGIAYISQNTQRMSDRGRYRL